jgi:hypothetical protein
VWNKDAGKEQQAAAQQQNLSITLTAFPSSTPILQSRHKNSYWQDFVLKRFLKSAPSAQSCSSFASLPNKISRNGHSSGWPVLSVLITPWSCSHTWPLGSWWTQNVTTAAWTYCTVSRVQLKCDGTWWRTGGEEGETGEWSGYPVLFTLPRNVVYPALLPLMCTPRLPVGHWTNAPADLNGLVRFAERRNLVSMRVQSHFNWLPYSGIHQPQWLLNNLTYAVRQEELQPTTFHKHLTYRRRGKLRISKGCVTPTFQRSFLQFVQAGQYGKRVTCTGCAIMHAVAFCNTESKY